MSENCRVGPPRVTMWAHVLGFHVEPLWHISCAIGIPCGASLSHKLRHLKWKNQLLSMLNGQI